MAWNGADSPSTTGHSKLILVGAPADESCSTVDSKQHQSGLPDHMSGLRVGTLLPNIGVSVLGRGYNTVGVRSPVNGGDWLVVL